MFKIFKNFIFFCLLVLFQAYFGADLFIKTSINFILIFLIFTFLTFQREKSRESTSFPFPLIYLIFLLLISGLALDALIALGWGMNLLSLFFAFGAGLFLEKVLEKGRFFSLIVKGEVIIAVYYFSLYLLSGMFLNLNIGYRLFLDFVLNSLFFLVILFFFMFLEKKFSKINEKLFLFH